MSASLLPEKPGCRAAASMTSSAELAVEQAGGRSLIDVLRSHGALALRPTHPTTPEPLIHRDPDAARVSVAAGAAGPLGGDDFRLNVHVGAGSRLILKDVSATLLLPGSRADRSRMRITVTVEDDADLVWQPEPVIAAAGCRHHHEIDVELAPGARLLMRDELVLGRHREPPGRLRQDVTVRRDGRSLYRQRLDLGFSHSDSPAIVGRHKSIGTVLIVDPDWQDAVPDPALIGPSAALMPLTGPAVTVNALAGDTVGLRHMLDDGITRIGAPWTPVN